MTVSTSTAPASETTTKEASNDDVVVEKKASAVVTPPSSTTDNKEQEKSTTDDSSTKATTVDKWNDAPSFSTSDDDWNAQFQAIWGNSTTSSSSESSNNNKEQMLQQTLHWMHRMVVDDLLPHAHQAMHREQQLLLQVQNLQDLLHDSQAALAQSQAAERKSQAALEKLHHAVQAATTQARDQADTIQQDAQLSLKLTQLQQELETEQISKTHVQHELKLARDELSSTKTLLSKKTAQVLQLERNARLVATATAASNGSSDLAFYKQKVQEWQTRQQGLTAALQEQTARCHDYQRQLLSMQGRHGGSSNARPKLKKRRFS